MKMLFAGLMALMLVVAQAHPARAGVEDVALGIALVEPTFEHSTPGSRCSSENFPVPSSDVEFVGVTASDGEVSLPSVGRIVDGGVTSVTPEPSCLYVGTVRLDRMSAFDVYVYGRKILRISSRELRSNSSGLMIGVDMRGISPESTTDYVADGIIDEGTAPQATATATTDSSKPIRPRHRLQSPTQTPPSSHRWQCDEVPAWYSAVFDAKPADNPMIDRWLDGELDMETMRPSQLRMLSEGTDEWATNLEAIPLSDIPLAAHEYHAAWIEMLSVVSSVTMAMSTGGLFSATAYTDAMETATADFENAQALMEERCPGTTNAVGLPSDVAAYRRAS